MTLTQQELGVIATAILYGPYPPKPEHMPACERMVERGWLERRFIGEHLVYALSANGATALALDQVLAEAKGSVN